MDKDLDHNFIDSDKPKKKRNKNTEIIIGIMILIGAILSAIMLFQSSSILNITVLNLIKEQSTLFRKIMYTLFLVIENVCIGFNIIIMLFVGYSLIKRSKEK